jgi:multiple sugar transport system ATP-binding protein
VLAEGELIQLGPPREVYEAPINAHVARRPGSPQINLLPSHVRGLADGPKGATIGVRPEDVIIGRGGVQAEVRTVEHLGAETVALLEVAGHQLHALLGPSDRLAPGDTATVVPRAGSLLYFNAAGNRVETARTPARQPAREAAYGT